MRDDEWLGAKGSWSNHYEDTFGQGGYGFRAQQKMGAVRGKDFKREMTKAKRSGRYTGGTIDPNATFSIKYDSD